MHNSDGGLHSSDGGLHSSDGGLHGSDGGLHLLLPGFQGVQAPVGGDDGLAHFGNEPGEFLGQVEQLAGKHAGADRFQPFRFFVQDAYQV